MKKINKYHAIIMAVIITVMALLDFKNYTGTLSEYNFIKNITDYSTLSSFKKNITSGNHNGGSRMLLEAYKAKKKFNQMEKAWSRGKRSSNKDLSATSALLTLLVLVMLLLSFMKEGRVATLVFIVLLVPILISSKLKYELEKDIFKEIKINNKKYSLPLFKNKSYE